jgi:hypothetical protein
MDAKVVFPSSGSLLSDDFEMLGLPLPFHPSRSLEAYPLHGHATFVFVLVLRGICDYGAAYTVLSRSVVYRPIEPSHVSNKTGLRSPPNLVYDDWPGLSKHLVQLRSIFAIHATFEERDRLQRHHACALW